MFDSIRLRLTLWYLGVLALIIGVFAVAAYAILVSTLARQTDEILAETARGFRSAVASELTPESDRKAIEDEIAEDVAESRTNHFTLIATDAATRRVVASTTPDGNLRDALTNFGRPEAFDSQSLGGKSYRVFRTTLDFNGLKYELRVVRDLDDQEEFLARLRNVVLAAAPFALLVAGVGGYFLARKSLAPVARMSSRAALIGATNLHERLPVGNANDELGALATTLNELLARLEDSFERRRRFMADASHELRTPLAIIRGESEVALSRADRSADELRESLEIVHDESKHLSAIVEELMTLARADAGELPAGAETVDVGELLEHCVRGVGALANGRGIRLEKSVEAPLEVRGDARLLRRLFVNLLDNAIKYNRDGGAVTVTGAAVAGVCRVAIADTGRGVDEADRPRIFDRFYRADQARRRREDDGAGGAGLGLSIALSIAQLHGGTIEIAETDDSGSVFVVELPLRS